MIHQVSEQHVEAQKAAGFPFLQGQEATLRALNALWFHAARRGRAPEPPPPAPPSDLTPATLDATLERYGITLPKSREVATAAEAAEAARRDRLPGGAEDPLAPTSCTRPRPAASRSTCAMPAKSQAAAERLVASARKA